MRKRQSSSFLCSSNSSIRSSNKNIVSSRCRFTFLSQLNRFTKHCKHIHFIPLFSQLVIVESQSSVIPSVSGCHLSRAIPRSRLEFRRLSSGRRKERERESLAVLRFISLLFRGRWMHPTAQDGITQIPEMQPKKKKSQNAAAMHQLETRYPTHPRCNKAANLIRHHRLPPSCFSKHIKALRLTPFT